MFNALPDTTRCIYWRTLVCALLSVETVFIFFLFICPSVHPSLHFVIYYSIVLLFLWIFIYLFWDFF